jgi:methylglyoxal reductase
MSPIAITPIVFGAMGLPQLSRALRTRLIHCAIDLGITSIDTAPLYGAGESERILGTALAGRRNHVQLLTKCGLRWDADHGQPMFEMLVDGHPHMVRKDSRPAGIRASLEASLRNLATDAIDLYQVHQYDDATPIEDVMQELERARAAGKIRAIGVSNYPVPALRRAMAAATGLFSTQSPYSLIQTNTAADVLAVAQETGLAFLAYEPLARGVLAGKFLQSAPDSAWGTPRGLRRVNEAIESTLLPLARERSMTVAQLALAWLLAQDGVTAAIAGASTEKQLAENAAVARMRLEPQIVAAISQAFRGRELEPPTSLTHRLRRRAGRLTRAVRRRLAAWRG